MTQLVIQETGQGFPGTLGAALIGAIVGAILTAGLGAWVQNHVAKKREWREAVSDGLTLLDSSIHRLNLVKNEVYINYPINLTPHGWAELMRARYGLDEVLTEVQGRLRILRARSTRDSDALRHYQDFVDALIEARKTAEQDAGDLKKKRTAVPDGSELSEQITATKAIGCKFETAATTILEQPRRLRCGLLG